MKAKNNAKNKFPLLLFNILYYFEQKYYFLIEIQVNIIYIITNANLFILEYQLCLF